MLAEIEKAESGIPRNQNLYLFFTSAENAGHVVDHGLPADPEDGIRLLSASHESMRKLLSTTEQFDEVFFDSIAYLLYGTQDASDNESNFHLCVLAALTSQKGLLHKEECVDKEGMLSREDLVHVITSSVCNLIPSNSDDGTVSIFKFGKELITGLVLNVVRELIVSLVFLQL